MSWASRRRTAYMGIIAFAALIILAPLFFTIFNKEPTCFDGKQNGDEKGIDCDGLCKRTCDARISNPTILWSRAFKVSDGVYNAVAYIENPNFDSGASNIPYTFKLFDDKNILIAERKGSTFISPNNITPIFETAIFTGKRTPSKTFFEFNKTPEWYKIDDANSSLSVSDIKLAGEESSPRIDAVLSNSSIYDARDIEVVAIVFDSKNNAIAASSTFIDRLSGRTSQNIVFTWPEKFDSASSGIKIIPRIPIAE